MSKTKYIEFHSSLRDQLGSTSTGDYIYDLPYEIKDVYNIRMVHAVIPFCYFQLTSSMRSITTDLGTAVLPEQHYSHSDLATALDTLLTGLGHSGVTVTYTSATDKFVIQSSDSPTWEITLHSDLAKVLGFSDASLTGSDIYTSDQSTQLNYFHRDLYIDVVDINSNLYVSQNHGSNFKLYNGSNFGDIIVFNSNGQYDQVSHNINSNINKRVKVKLRYSDGSVCDLRGCDWSFMIQLNY